MLFEDNETGVVIADGRCGVRLSRLGEADALGFPTEIEVRAGPFSGAVLDDALPFSPRFVAQVEALHATLRGEAELSGYEGFSLRMVGDGRGGVRVSVVVVASHVPEIRLTFEFDIDQTYLPAILGAIRREFPPPAEAC